MYIHIVESIYIGVLHRETTECLLSIHIVMTLIIQAAPKRPGTVGQLPFLARLSLIVPMVGKDWSRPQSDIPRVTMQVAIAAKSCCG
jgi:hypothetical protein